MGSTCSLHIHPGTDPTNSFVSYVIPFDVISVPPLAMRLSLLYKLVSMGTQSPPTLFQDAIL